MNFSVISVFPEIIAPLTQLGLIGKAIEKNLLKIDLYNLRDYAANKHRKVDDRPFGGGPGMVLMPQPLFDAVDAIKEKQGGRVILLSAYGQRFNQKKAQHLAQESHLILVCGRYEGVDQRVIDTRIDEEISIGEYVLMGGEVGAMVLIECISRMVSGVVGNPESVESDSFYYRDQMASPQYTQPREYRGLKVPDVLLNGNHKSIEEWRNNHQKKTKS